MIVSRDRVKNPISRVYWPQLPIFIFGHVLGGFYSESHHLSTVGCFNILQLLRGNLFRYDHPPPRSNWLISASWTQIRLPMFFFGKKSIKTTKTNVWVVVFKYCSCFYPYLGRWSQVKSYCSNELKPPTGNIVFEVCAESFQHNKLFCAKDLIPCEVTSQL